ACPSTRRCTFAVSSEHNIVPFTVKIAGLAKNAQRTTKTPRTLGGVKHAVTVQLGSGDGMQSPCRNMRQGLLGMPCCDQAGSQRRWWWGAAALAWFLPNRFLKRLGQKRSRGRKLNYVDPLGAGQGLGGGRLGLDLPDRSFRLNQAIGERFLDVAVAFLSDPG